MHTSGWTSKLLVGLAVALLQSERGNADIQSNATCASSFGWAANSLNQQPCLIAAYLQGACSSGVWTTPALPNNGTRLAYNSPDPASRNQCTCSWAVYNLLSACAACQDGAWRQWSAWSSSCLTATANLISTQAFPPEVPVPPETIIPEYAAKDPSTWTGGLFNVTEARAIGSYNVQITTSVSSSSTSTAPTTSTTSPASNDGGPAVGPIVGGVVGGVLGLALIAVLATFLLCPARFRREQKAGVEYPSIMKQESQSPTPASQMQPVSGVMAYDPSIGPARSQQGLVAPGPRPPLGPRFTPSEYSFGTSADHHSATPSMALQPMQQAATIPVQSPGPTPSPPNSNVHTFVPEASINDQSTISSVRSIFTRAAPRYGHAHTPSDTSVTSASSLLPWIQQGIRRQQSGSGNVVVPYVTPSSSNSSQYPVDRKARPTGLQYTPPPDATGSFGPQVESSAPSEGSTINMLSPTLLPPGAHISTPTTTENIYGIMIPSSLVNDGDVEADRRTNMSPANASSILEAAPPYASDDHLDLGVRGMPLRRTPRLPDVDEYPEEKARFTNAAGVD